MVLNCNDILFNVLLNLPLKPLIQFQTVSRTWRNCITSLVFTQHYQKLFKDCESNSLLVFKSSNNCFYLVNDFNNKLLLRPEKLSLPRPFQDDHTTQIIDSCNGLVCMGRPRMGKFINSFIILNPIKSMVVYECKGVPSMSLKKQGQCIDYVVSGFGYDHVTEDYKIVFFWHRSDWTRSKYKGMVYGLKSDSWRPLYVPDIGKKWTYIGAVNNFLHFIAETNDASIIQFDLCSEEWGVIYFPPHQGPHMKIRDVCILDKRLSCVVVPCDGGDRLEELWMMNEYGVHDSWTKVLSLPYFGCCRAVSYSETLNQFLLYHDYIGLFWYGSEAEEVDCRLVWYHSDEEEDDYDSSVDKEGCDHEEEEAKGITRLSIEGNLKISDIRTIMGSLVSVEAISQKIDVHRERENSVLESQKEGDDSKDAENAETNNGSRKNNRNKKKNKKKNRVQN